MRQCLDSIIEVWIDVDGVRVNEQGAGAQLTLSKVQIHHDPLHAAHFMHTRSGVKSNT